MSSNGPSFKKQKLEEKILFSSNALMRKELRDKRLQFVSITKVELNSDMSVATLYWDTFDASKRGDAKLAMDQVKTKIRSHLSKILQMRTVPHIDVKYDNQHDEQANIEKILDNEAKAGKH